MSVSPASLTIARRVTIAGEAEGAPARAVQFNLLLSAVCFDDDAIATILPVLVQVRISNARLLASTVAEFLPEMRQAANIHALV